MTETVRRRRRAIDPAAATEIVKQSRSIVAGEYDGLQVDPASGQFTRRDLVPGWVVEGRVRIDPNDFGLISVAVRPVTEESGDRVTSRLLRSIPVAVLLNEIRQRLILADTIVRRAHVLVEGAEPAQGPLQLDLARRGTRRLADARKQALLRRVALAYLDEQGQPGVYARLGRRFRRDAQDIKALIRAARADGWLAAAATHGMRGGGPGPRLLQDEEFTKRGEL